MSKQNFDYLLAKYIDGKCTPDEQRLVEQWYDLIGNDIETPKSDIEWKDLRGKMWLAVQEKKKQEEKEVFYAVSIPFWKTTIFRIGIAACLMIGLSFYFLMQKNQPILEELTTSYSNGMIIKENQTQKTLAIILEDGSSVQLFPQAKLSFPKHFETNKREVSLDGDAFFDVQKNADRPFFITTGEAITKVLGTSFLIKASKQSKIEVEVKTGRVAVYAKKISNKKDNGVVLTPNLKVTFFNEEKLFVTGLVDKPTIQEHIIEEKKIAFVFDETPLSEVLKVLGQAYGIEIMTDNEKLNHALLTANITDQDLYTKLDIICAAINAHYEVKGTNILLTQP